MIDTLTVVRKELLEVLGNKHASRGALVQAGILVALLGVLIPATDASVWRDARSAAMLYLVFPATLAATVAADAFAGERERKTLETLLATPLSDRAIFLGKALAAILFSGLSAAATLLAAVVTTLLTRASSLPSAAHLLAILGGALGAAAISAALATAISMRVLAARSAQQASSLLSIAVAGGATALLGELGVPITWSTLPWIDAALATAGALALAAAMAGFRRDRFFDVR